MRVSFADYTKRTSYTGTVSLKNFDSKKYHKHMGDWLNTLNAGNISDIVRKTPIDIRMEAQLLISEYNVNHDNYLSADEVQKMRDLGIDKIRDRFFKKQKEKLRKKEQEKDPVGYARRRKNAKRLQEKFCKTLLGDKYKPHSKNIFKA